MKRLVLTIFLASMTMISMAEEKSTLVPGINPQNLDTSINPKDDFFQYATGGWQKLNPLTAEYSRYGSFEKLMEQNDERIRNLFDQIASREAEKGSVEQKIADLYRMGLDTARLNREGMTPVKEDMKRIMSIRNQKDVVDALVWLHKSVANPIFVPAVMADMKQSDKNALYIYQSGLGMGERDYYLDKESEHIRKAYREYLKSIFTQAGLDKAEVKDAVEAVMKLEKKMAKHQYSNVELRDNERAYNPMSYKGLKKAYKGFDWDRYFVKGLGLKDLDRVIVSQPEYLTVAVKLISESSIEDLRYYLLSQYLHSASSYLNEQMYETSFNFFERTLTGTEKMKPLWKRAMATPNSILGEAVGEIYVGLFFPEKDKERMLTLVENLRTSLGQHIDNLEWMSPETKAKAHEKLSTITVKIGYPDKWKDYSSLEINPEQGYWANIVRANVWDRADNLAELSKPVDRTKWYFPPQTVNAYYSPNTNEICFPAGILQPPFYNSNADDAVNYGGIGVVIGHEMIHGFDDQGRRFDKDGNMAEWWTAQDAEAFKKRTDVLVGQFDAVEVVPGIFANGTFTLGENIADQGGLRVAYTAMLNSQKGTEPEKIDGFTAAQRFFISYAALWSQNIREQEMIRRTKSDPHSLGSNRVNITLRNIDEFHKAFGITEGKMFLPTEKRIIIW